MGVGKWAERQKLNFAKLIKQNPSTPIKQIVYIESIFEPKNERFLQWFYYRVLKTLLFAYSSKSWCFLRPCIGHTWPMQDTSAVLSPKIALKGPFLPQKTRRCHGTKPAFVTEVEHSLP